MRPSSDLTRMLDTGQTVANAEEFGRTCFISYSRHDKKWLERFHTHLAPLIRSGLSIWDDTCLSPGSVWADTLAEVVDKCAVAFLLVSPEYLASDFIDKWEIDPIVKREQRGEILVLWAHLRSCMYNHSKISKFQAAHDPSKPLHDLSVAARSSVLSSICARLQEAIDTSHRTHDSRSQIESTPKAGTIKDSKVQFFIILDGNLKETDSSELERVLDQLKRLSRSEELRLIKIEHGSIKLTMIGSIESLENLQFAYLSGELERMTGYVPRALVRMKGTQIQENPFSGIEELKLAGDPSPSESPVLPSTPDATARLLDHLGLAWWRDGDVSALEHACAAMPKEQLAHWPSVARWRALAALLRDQGDAESCLELAHAAHQAQGNLEAAACDAHIALTTYMCGIGTVNRQDDWLARARSHRAAVPPRDDHVGLWARLGLLARTVLGPEFLPEADVALQWLQDQLRPRNDRLSPDERLIAAQVLVSVHIARQQYEQVDHLATLVEEPDVFERAVPVVRGRWLHALGYAHYQTGDHQRAEAAWKRAIALAQAHGLLHIGLIATLATLRLLLDYGRLDEAQRIEASVQARWGTGLDTQLIELQQVRARLQLLCGQPARAVATLQEALALAGPGSVGAPQQASLLTDLAQAEIAHNRPDRAASLLDRLASEHTGRDADVYLCLGELLQAWRARVTDQNTARARLVAGLQRAQALRYTRFFRLLPVLAADLCALALRWSVEPAFVAEVIQTRNLRASPEADGQWPWTLWLRMFGGFELVLRRQLRDLSGNQHDKALELLRLLGCERNLSVTRQAAAAALWPEANPVTARTHLRWTVHGLRRLLVDDSLVQVDARRIALDPERVSSDVARRRDLLSRVEALAMQSQAEDDDARVSARSCAALLARIADLGGGTLLPDEPPWPWLEAERQRCEREARRAATAAYAVLERAGASATERELVAGTFREISRR